MIVFRGWSKGMASRVYISGGGKPVGYVDLVDGSRHPESGRADDLDDAVAQLIGRLSNGRRAQGMSTRRPGETLEVLAGRTRDKTRRDRFLKGAAGERCTADLLARVDGLSVLHSMPLAGDHDLDHVVCARSGVWAVNTKTTSYPVDVAGDEVRVAGRRQYWAERARIDAGAVESMLRRAGVAVPVTPLVAVWACRVSGESDVVVPADRLPDLVSGQARVPAGVAWAAWEAMCDPGFWGVS